MYAESVRVTLKPNHGFTPTELAKAIHGFSSYDLKDSLIIARLMIRGEGWEPEPPSLKFTDDEAKSPNFYWGWFNFKIEYPPNPYQEQAARWKMQRELLEKGAAGDAEAAIRYCQMELNHEISHGAMG
jgi:hypothetical protein